MGAGRRRRRGWRVARCRSPPVEGRDRGPARYAGGPVIGPPRPAATSEVPVLLRAVHTTIRTIETRARIYRWAAVAVALSLVVPIVSALVCSSWRPLTLA